MRTTANSTKRWCSISFESSCTEVKPEGAKKTNICLAREVKSLCKLLDFRGLLITAIDSCLSSQLDQWGIFRPCLAMCQLSHSTLPFICTPAHAASAQMVTYTVHYSL